MTKRTTLILAATGTALLGVTGWLGVRAQVLPTPSLPPLPFSTSSPSPAPSPTRGASVTLPRLQPTIPEPQLTPTTLTPFVPVGADPVSLVGGGVLLTPATNTNPPINTYSSALSYLYGCDAYANANIVEAGFTHVELLNQTDTGAPYQADVWAFAMKPYSYPDDLWMYWFIDSSTGSCRGVGYGPATADTRPGPMPPQTLACIPETNLCEPYPRGLAEPRHS